MKVHSAEIQKGVLTLSMEIPVDEHRSCLDRAAGQLSQQRPIAGFRAGRAPYDVVVREFGEAVILETAADDMISKAYAQAIREGHYEAIGSPSVRIEKLAPGNPLLFSASVPLLPEVTIGDITTLQRDSREVSVEEKEIAGVIEELRQLQSMENKVNRPANATDRVVVDLSMAMDNVPVESGMVTNHSMILDKPYYIPGLSEKIVGMDIGPSQTFTLPFPQEHYQKYLAGKNVDFTVTIKEIFERTLPAADDAFASKLGQADIAALRALLRANILSDKQRKEKDRQERALLDQLITSSRFGDIPEQLVTQEAWRIMGELEDNVRRDGGEFQAYLDSIKKTQEQLYVDFAPRALERVKVSLLVRALAIRESIEATPQEIDQAVQEVKQQYKSDPKLLERINAPEMREYASTMIRNRKVIGWLAFAVK